MRGLGKTLALFFVFALSLSACGFGTAKPAQTPDQLLTLAFKNLEKSSSYRVQGTYTSTVPRVDVDVTAVAPGAAMGSITDDTRAAKLEFISRQGRIYLSGTSLPGLPGKLSQYLTGKWVYNSVAGSEVEPLISTGKLASPASLEDAFLRGQTGMAEKSITIAGKKALQLSNAAEKVSITTGVSPQLVKIERPVGASPQDGFTQVNLDFGEYSWRSSLDAPADAVDLGDPTGLPAHYALLKDSLALVACSDASSCGAKVTVTNSAGAIDPVPPAVVKFSFKKDSDGSLIDSCTASIPLIAHGASEEVSCRVVGDAWHNFVINGGGHYTASPELSNPLYD
jgi:hypothetical protein